MGCRTRVQTVTRPMIAWYVESYSYDGQRFVKMITIGKEEEEKTYKAVLQCDPDTHAHTSDRQSVSEELHTSVYPDGRIVRA